MVVCKFFLTAFLVLFYASVSVDAIVPKIFIDSEFGDEPDGVIHDGRVSKNKVKKLLNEDFSHLIEFSFTFTFRIDVYIFSYWINLWEFIRTYGFHGIIYL